MPDGKTRTRDELIDEWQFRRDATNYASETEPSVYIALRDRCGHKHDDYYKGSAVHSDTEGRLPALLSMDADRGRLIMATDSWYTSWLEGKQS
jgi:hypothetical protein